MYRRFLPIALLLAATATLCAQTTPSFELNRDTYPIYGSMTVVQGDFNRDGKPDILMGASASSPDDLTIRLGNGDGTFQAPLTVGSIPNGPYDMVTADLNGDGKLDLVAVTIVNNPNLYVWYGNGDGTFQAPLTYSTANSPRSVTVGNFYGSGRLDIAVGEINGVIQLYKNGSGGNFALSGSLTLSPASDVIRVRAGDFNNDGSSDFAALDGSAAYVMWNNGQGNFHQTELGPYPAPTDLNVGDLNQDGMADIIVSYTCNPTPTNNPDKGPEYNACAGYDVYYSQGNEKTFQRTVVTDPGVMSGTQPWAVDVNGDGVADIAAASTPDGYGGAGLYVWLGHPDGSFDQTPYVFTASSGGSGGIAPGDWNRDGMMDFAMTLPGDGMTQIYINGGNRAPCSTSRISPTVTVCQPVDGTYSNSPVRVQANAYDETTVTAMQEYVDSKLVYSQNVNNFNTTFAEALGTHFFVTKAWDASGLSFRSNRTVTVYSGTPGPACPTAPNSASICLPSGTTASPVRILANGYAPWIPTSAQLYIDGNLVVNNQGCGSDGACGGGTSYVDTTQSLSSGNHDLVFKLWDANGDVYQAQKTIDVQ